MSQNDVDWSSYAAVYDLMSRNNPAYQSLVELVSTTVKEWDLGLNCRIVDFGAGTGNFSLEIAGRVAGVKVIHIDSDIGMLGAAQRKAQVRGLPNITFAQADMASMSFEPESLDAAISIHAIYACPHPELFLKKLSGWLKPGAPVLLCDFGREMKVLDWGLYLLKSMQRKMGIFRAAAIMLRGRDVARQNRRISAMQRTGRYWKHTPQEFRAAVESSGLYVVEQKLCYRGYSDLVICRNGTKKLH